MTVIADTKTRHIHTHNPKTTSFQYLSTTPGDEKEENERLRFDSYLYKSLKLEERRETTSQSSFPAASLTTKAPLALQFWHVFKEKIKRTCTRRPSRSRKNASCIAKTYGSPGDLAATRTSIPFIRTT
ncbi:hypothetical protein QQF64_015715 [Cirrhinus molitorella]|uniref:Uncharacterized protein n=1 Tax=Cirrhinus molitorella TaxID=172907 RepID=A0ABR3NVQ3_9TELE